MKSLRRDKIIDLGTRYHPGGSACSLVTVSSAVPVMEPVVTAAVVCAVSWAPEPAAGAGRPFFFPSSLEAEALGSLTAPAQMGKPGPCWEGREASVLPQQLCPPVGPLSPQRPSSYLPTPSPGHAHLRNPKPRARDQGTAC